MEALLFIVCLIALFPTCYLLIKMAIYHNIKTSPNSAPVRLYPQFLFIAFANELMSHRGKYMDMYGEDYEDYEILRMLLGKLPKLYETYARKVLEAPMPMKRGIDETSAGFIGTLVGGTLTGIYASEKAKEHEKKYQENRRAVIESSIETDDAMENAYNCFKCIDELLGKNPNTAYDWVERKNEIRDEVWTSHKFYNG